MTKIEEIYSFVLPEMASNGIEDTTENRLAFLEGLADGWKEDTDSSLEKTLYQVALTGEISRLMIKLHFRFLMK